MKVGGCAVVPVDPRCTHITHSLVGKIAGINGIAISVCLVGVVWMSLGPECVGGAGNGVAKITDPMLTEDSRVGGTVDDIAEGQVEIGNQNTIWGWHSVIRIAGIGRW